MVEMEELYSVERVASALDVGGDRLWYQSDISRRVVEGKEKEKEKKNNNRKKALGHMSLSGLNAFRKRKRMRKILKGQSSPDVYYTASGTVYKAAPSQSLFNTFYRLNCFCF